MRLEKKLSNFRPEVNALLEEIQLLIMSYFNST